jgi:hypothetical protein
MDSHGFGNRTADSQARKESSLREHVAISVPSTEPSENISRPDIGRSDIATSQQYSKQAKFFLAVTISTK